MENLKDQQIERQGETIKSLERKVESLERELQKHMDPDSGEIRPTWRPASRKPLDLFKDNHLSARLYTMITAAFLPIRVYRDAENRKMQYDFQAWDYFRAILFDVDLFDNHWTRPEFRKGVELLNDIIQATEGYHTDAKKLDEHELAHSFYGFADDYDQRQYDAVQALSSALVTILENQDHPKIKNMVHEENFKDILVSLTIIAECQRQWMDARPKETQPQN